MIIREATIKDIDIIYEVENICFPASEAATKGILFNRLQHYANHFWLMFDDNKLVSFIDGMVTNQKDLTDDLYECANLHNENGSWQMIFGVNTIHEYRKRGLASELMNIVIENAKQQNRKGLVLTCKKELIPFYSKFGFINEGISCSTHGNIEWFQMRLTF